MQQRASHNQARLNHVWADAERRPLCCRSPSSFVLCYLLPAYSSYKALRTGSRKAVIKLLMYWTVLSVFKGGEYFSDLFLGWCVTARPWQGLHDYVWLTRMLVARDVATSDQAAAVHAAQAGVHPLADPAADQGTDIGHGESPVCACLTPRRAALRPALNRARRPGLRARLPQRHPQPVPAPRGRDRPAAPPGAAARANNVCRHQSA